MEGGKIVVRFWGDPGAEGGGIGVDQVRDPPFRKDFFHLSKTSPLQCRKVIPLSKRIPRFVEEGGRIPAARIPSMRQG